MAWRSQARGLWAVWTAFSVFCVAIALLDPPWLPNAPLPTAFVGLLIVSPPRPTSSARQDQWPAWLARHRGRSLRAMARQSVGVVAMAAGLGLLVLGRSAIDAQLRMVVVPVVLAGAVDSAVLHHATRAWRAEQRRLAPPAAPSRVTAFTPEMWEEEGELPPDQAERWEAFLDRAHRAGHDAHDDLDQIDDWYEERPPT